MFSKRRTSLTEIHFQSTTCPVEMLSSETFKPFPAFSSRICMSLFKCKSSQRCRDVDRCIAASCKLDEGAMRSLQTVDVYTDRRGIDGFIHAVIYWIIVRLQGERTSRAQKWSCSHSESRRCDAFHLFSPDSLIGWRLYEFPRAASVAVTRHWPRGAKCQQHRLRLTSSNESEFAESEEAEI